MKTLLITIATLFFTILTAQAQRIGINTIMKVQNSKPVECEDLLLNLGFTQDPFGKIENYDIYSFAKNKTNNDSYMSIQKYCYNGKNIKTSFYTLYKSDYIAIKNSLSKLGFKHANTINKDGDVFHKYQKGNVTIDMLISYQRENDNKPMYLIDYTDLQNQEYYFNNQ